MRAPQVLEDPCHPSHGGQFLWASPQGRRYTRAHTCSHSLTVLLGVRGVCTGGGDRGEEEEAGDRDNDPPATCPAHSMGRGLPGCPLGHP